MTTGETKERLPSSERGAPTDKARGARETANARPDERAVAERLATAFDKACYAHAGCGCNDADEPAKADICDAAKAALLAHFDQVRNSADAEIAKVMAEWDELQCKLKNYEPVSTYNGRQPAKATSKE